MQHVIIGGANKCGTTSLFRYLSDHPRVAPSVVKESAFFYATADLSPEVAYREYMTLFPTLSAEHDCVLEATPSYLDSGRRIAERIIRTLPEVRLLFMLRDPVERLVSYYRSQQGLLSTPVRGLSFEEFVEKAVQEDSRNRDGARALGRHPLALQLDRGKYGQNLQSYLAVVPRERMHVLFFESLKADPRSVVASACRLLGLDPTLYDDYDFTIENQSRFHRSAALRTGASRLNRRLEPFLNRFPALRRLARSAYVSLNTVPTGEFDISEAGLERARDYYAPLTAHYAEAIRGLSIHTDAPAWLDPKS